MAAALGAHRANKRTNADDDVELLAHRTPETPKKEGGILQLEISRTA